jgi:hypothetical protein
MRRTHEAVVQLAGSRSCWGRPLFPTTSAKPRRGERSPRRDAPCFEADSRLHPASRLHKNGPAREKNPTPQERTVSDRPAPPPGLEKVGRTLWADVLDDAPEHATLDARTRSILATACPKPTKTQRSSKHSRMRGSPSAGRPGSGDSMLRRPRLARVAWPSRGCLSRSASTAFSARPITTWRPYRHG